MGAPLRDERRVASAWVLSVLAHAAVIGAAGWIVAHTLAGSAGRLADRDVRRSPGEAAAGAPGLARGAANGSEASDIAIDDVVLEAAPRGGGEHMPRLDTGRAGRGGQNASAEPAVNLADRDEGLRLSREPMSRRDRDQIQRVRSARHRSSREDWRASREPMELTLLANGDGTRLERRKLSPVDPSSGGRDDGAPANEGATLGGEELANGGLSDPRALGGPMEGAERATLGLGVRDGAPGSFHADAAHVALARPMVPLGTPSVPAEARGRPSDTLDSEQEVALRMQSIVHASTAGGAPGEGRGGQEGGGMAGAGGVRGAGSIANALGSGSGSDLDVASDDQRRSLYMRTVLQKINPLWSFPKDAALAGRQGTVIVSFTILADGSITPPRIARASGIPAFDEICRRAVLRAAPFSPLPSELGTSLRWSMPFEGMNPAVRPKAVSSANVRP